MRNIFLLTLFILTQHLAAAPAIIKGEDASLRDFPWQVSIQNRDGHICGGSIISSRYILTAAHCLTHSDLEVYGGGDGNIWRVGKLGTIKRKVLHDGWKITRRLNDIGLIELESDIAFSDDVQKIELANHKDFKVNMKAIVTGFGVLADPNINGDIVFAKHLQKAELVLGDYLGNANFWRNKFYSYYSDNYVEYKQSAIADIPKRSFQDRIGPCYADSGGPLVIKNSKGEYKLLGIVSKLIEGCGLATVFTFVPSHVEWINNNL